LNLASDTVESRGDPVRDLWIVDCRLGGKSDQRPSGILKFTDAWLTVSTTPIMMAREPLTTNSIVHIRSDLYMSIMNPMTSSIIVKLQLRDSCNQQKKKTLISYSHATHLISNTLCTPLNVAFTPSTVCSLILSAMTLAIPPSVMNLTPCSTPLQVAMICAFASSARACAELLADKKDARARSKERSGRERIV
jgi:hypothetical protein